MFISILSFIVFLILLSLAFSIFLPIFLILALVVIVTRTDLKNGLVIALIIAIAGYVMTEDILSLTNILMFPVIVYVFKRIEPKAFKNPIFGPNYQIDINNMLKLFVIALVFMAIGSLFSSIFGWVFGISFIVGVILFIPLLIVFGILSHLFFIFIIIPLTALLRTIS